ncbi:disease resistance protein rpm1 [Hordeum vulgare]|nr:disease resistance protein rpm1 [Hordeum vulgare]
MEQHVFKCQGMVERGLNANHMMIMEFTSKHRIDANDIGKHLSKLYDKIDQLQAHIYDLQNQNYEWGKGHGRLYLHPVSRWIMVRDDTGDILAGRYLSREEVISLGLRLEIDVFLVEVGRLIPPPQEEATTFDSPVCDDLTGIPVCDDCRRFGGRFWVLASEDDEDELEERPVESSSQSLPADHFG